MFLFQLLPNLLSCSLFSSTSQPLPLPFSYSLIFTSLIQTWKICVFVPPSSRHPPSVTDRRDLIPPPASGGEGAEGCEAGGWRPPVRWSYLPQTPVAESRCCCRCCPCCINKKVTRPHRKLRGTSQSETFDPLFYLFIFSYLVPAINLAK